MYAIVDIAGQQFKVEKDQKIFVNRLTGDAGSKVEFTDVLLVDNNGKVSVGAPLVSGAVVNATILAHARGEKVKIFKKKRRKGYQKETGHRQDLTQLKIEGIKA
ncbi:MAG: 50S ribosomal protein L21 [Bacteroidales bacterium]|nr:50S ribosomal protein L21 [Bacteroidales bacterium]